MLAPVDVEIDPEPPEPVRRAILAALAAVERSRRRAGGGAPGSRSRPPARTSRTAARRWPAPRSSAGAERA